MRFSGVVALALAMLHPVGLSAQTRFEWPDTTLNLARYTTPEDCYAILFRMREDLNRQQQWKGVDTLPIDRGEPLTPAPTALTRMVAQCAKPFSGATVDLADFQYALEVFLAAGRDSDAMTVVTRQLAAIAPTDTAKRSQTIDSIVKIHLRARPARLAALETILLRHAHDRLGRVERLKAYADLESASDAAGDTVRGHRFARWIVALADSLTPAERQSDQFRHMGNNPSGALVDVFLAVRDLAGIEPQLDSLHKSTGAFVALQQAFWAQVTGGRGSTLPSIGKRPPALTADYWFPSSARAVPHPTPGSPTLIIFMKQSACISEPPPGGQIYSACDGFLAQVRRMARRNPALEIVFMTFTEGHFAYLAPPPPAEEAALQAQWLDSLRVPGAVLGVTATPFFRLPDPDRRRIDPKDLPNYTNYDLTGGLGNLAFTTFLVDGDGIIVNARVFAVGVDDETELNQMIDVLLSRRRAGN